jgi:hypothetical protein
MLSYAFFASMPLLIWRTSTCNPGSPGRTGEA